MGDYGGHAFGARTNLSSSNAFACGSDQNRGNFLSDRPTSRVLRPPGGGSSISLGWSEPQKKPAPNFADRGSPRQEMPAAGGYASRDSQREQRRGFPSKSCDGADEIAFGGRPRGESSNSFACGQNQNCGNVITGRSSTRVAQSPGGASTMSLSWGHRDGRDAAAVAATPTPLGNVHHENQRHCDRGYENGGMPNDDFYRPRQGSDDYSSREDRFYASQSMGDTMPYASQPMHGNERDEPMPHDDRYYGQQRRPSDDSYGSQGRNQHEPDRYQPNDDRYHAPASRGGCDGRSYDDRGNYPQMNDRDREAHSRVNNFSVERDVGSRQGNAQLDRGPAQRQPPAEFGVRPRTGSNNFANGNNQNCGNMITDVPTTRVLQAPGGRSNFTLG